MKFDLGNAEESMRGMDAALAAIKADELIVLPTDTVYGVGANAFSPDAVQRLLTAKGRGRDMPPPVLVSASATLKALAVDVPSWAMRMLEELWPGPLTVICFQQPSLSWDLGDTLGTVAVRMPDHEQALSLLRSSGPLAVSSANATGQEAALKVDEAMDMLGDSVQVYLDDGPAPGSVPSTILDITSSTPRVLRVGGVDTETLHRFNNTIEP